MSIASRNRIDYQIADSTPGPAADRGPRLKGLCSLMWGDRRSGAVWIRWRGGFSGTPSAPVWRSSQRWLEPVNRFLGGDPVDLSFPLDLVGTPFQRAVWRRLQEIPLGRTLTYANLAAALGNPGRSPGSGQAPAPPIRWRWSSPATGSFAATAAWEAIAGGCSGSSKLLSLEASMAEDGPLETDRACRGRSGWAPNCRTLFQSVAPCRRAETLDSHKPPFHDNRQNP